MLAIDKKDVKRILIISLSLLALVGACGESEKDKKIAELIESGFRDYEFRYQQYDRVKEGILKDGVKNDPRLSILYSLIPIEPKGYDDWEEAKYSVYKLAEEKLPRYENETEEIISKCKDENGEIKKIDIFYGENEKYFKCIKKDIEKRQEIIEKVKTKCLEQRIAKHCQLFQVDPLWD
ncbi:MAG: hypothetical protein CL764_06025 [Chloroflexi bacterium]|nr:hypothetical protein [Chloroflexota bacterium]|tara:strand:- start:2372 stop:2908 length:537 start_codon:yes stop_codon:yes gene_type:complete